MWWFEKKESSLWLLIACASQMWFWNFTWKSVCFCNCWMYETIPNLIQRPKLHASCEMPTRGLRTYKIRRFIFTLILRGSSLSKYCSWTFSPSQKFNSQKKQIENSYNALAKQFWSDSEAKYIFLEIMKEMIHSSKCIRNYYLDIYCWRQ